MSNILTLRWIARACAIAGVFCLASSCRPAVTEQPTGYAGRWVMTLGQRVFLVMTIERQGETFAARIQGPSSFGLPAPAVALRYSDVKLPIQERHTSRATIEGDHLHLVLIDPAHPEEPDELEFTLDGQDRGALQLTGVPVAPLPFVRHVGTVPSVATDWDSTRTYALVDEPTTPNPEMASIYDEDQKVRQGATLGSGADWRVIRKADAERRSRTSALLVAGALHTADDYRKAAFVFQHGDRSDDYLLAHTLALVALAKGGQGSAWIAAATLDRYLQSINRPQIYGTQFSSAAGRTTQGPYNQALISDLLRAELGVPSIAGQVEQRKTSQPTTEP